MSDLDATNETLRTSGLPEFSIDNTFPPGTMVAVAERPLPPGIEDYRLRLVEIIDSIYAAAKREVEALPADLRAQRSLEIFNRAQERSQEFVMQLTQIEEMYRQTIVTVRYLPVYESIVLDIPASPLTPSGSQTNSKDT